MVASSKTVASSSRAAKPHILGGSNSLVAERNRREKAEAALQTTRQNLRTVAQDLTPQLQQLAQAVEALQVEKRHRLQLDEASQELLETLQDQINEVEKRQQQCCVVDCRIENAVKNLDDQSTADRYELRELISRLQEVQDEQATEIRLLHQELVASKEFMTKRLNAIEDAVTRVRSEIARGSEQQHVTMQSHADKIDELDEKLFALDKELLKLKLALPVSVKAQIPVVFTDQRSATGTTSRMDSMQNGDLAVTFKLHELAADLEAVKADSIAYRSTDRKQFDALTNRMREAAKSHHALKKEVESRLQEIRTCYGQMITKIPSELSKRLQKAQAAWSDELEVLKTSVLNLEAFYNVQKRKESSAAFKRQSRDPELHKLLERVKTLQKEVDSVRDEQESYLTRIDADLLGLYDWTRNKVDSIRSPSEV